MTPNTATATVDQIDETIIDIADESEIVATGGKSWRFANGKIVRGEEIEDQQGTYEEERDSIVGRLDRVGIYHGTDQTNGSQWLQIEADIETSGGTVHVKGSLNDGDVTDRIVLKPSVSAVKFAYGLSRTKKGDQIRIKTRRSDERVTLPSGKKGGYMTYVNFDLLERKLVKGEAKWFPTPIMSPRRDPNAPKRSLEEQWLELEPQIRAHTAYAERAVRQDGEAAATATHLSLFVKECEAKGWPSPERATGPWLAVIARCFGHPVRETLRDYTDHEWGQVRLGMEAAPIPPEVQAVLDQAAAPAAAAAEVTATPSGFNAGAAAPAPNATAVLKKPGTPPAVPIEQQHDEFAAE